MRRGHFCTSFCASCLLQILLDIDLKYVMITIYKLGWKMVPVGRMIVFCLVYVPQYHFFNLHTIHLLCYYNSLTSLTYLAIMLAFLLKVLCLRHKFNNILSHGTIIYGMNRTTFVCFHQFYNIVTNSIKDHMPYFGNIFLCSALI